MKKVLSVAMAFLLLSSSVLPVFGASAPNLTVETRMTEASSVPEEISPPSPAPLALISFELDKPLINLPVGGTSLLEVVNILPLGAVLPGVVTWHSSNPTVVSVDSAGNITAHSAGEATITASVLGLISASSAVTVSEAPVPLTGFTLNENNVSLTVGQNLGLSVATYIPANATGILDATWQSTNSSVVTVDGNGLLTAVGVGTATVTGTILGIAEDVAVNVTPAKPLQSFTLNKTTAKIKTLGTSVIEVASYTPADTDSNKTATWQSSNPLVATVLEGVITGLLPGTSTITCTVAGKTATCAVTVADVINPLESFTLNQSTASLITGDGVALSIGNLVPADTDTLLTPSWESSNNTVATVDVGGNVVAVAPGTATITANIAGIMATSAISVTAVGPTKPLQSFTLNKTATTIKTGTTDTLMVASYTPADTDSDKTATWQSSNTLVATVVDGTVLGVLPGTATITCTIAGKTATCTVTVADSLIPLTAFALSPSTVSLAEGDNVTLTAGGFVPSNTDSDLQSINWQSSNVAVATVDVNDKIVAVAPGTATITATIAGVSATTAVTVTPASPSKPLQSFTLNKTTVSTEVGRATLLAVASYTPADTDSDKTATWQSSDNAVAMVAANGTVTALAAGTATITCTVAGKTATCVVTVAALPTKPLQSFTLNKTTAQVKTAASVQLEVTSYTPADTDSDKTATWQSSDLAVASVVDGLVVGLVPGTATITCTIAGKTATCAVTVLIVSNPLTQFTLNPASVSLAAGDNVTLTAGDYVPSNTDSDLTVSWQSSNTAVATVDANSKVVAIAPGAATITATISGVTATTAVTVTPSAPTKPLQSFTLNQTTASLEVGKTTQLQVASYTPADTDSDKTATWQSSNTPVATVSSTGIVTAVAAGTAIITCTVAGKTATCKITVTSKTLRPLQSFTLNQTTASLEVGKTTLLKVASYIPANTDSNKSAVWQSSHPATATVAPDGTITAKAAGTAIITCTVAGKTATCKVTVTPKPLHPLQRFTLNQSVAFVEVGKTTLLKVASYVPVYTDSNKTASWQSSNPAIATVDANGTVTAKAVGTATITCTVAGKTATSKITVVAAGDPAFENTVKGFISRLYRTALERSPDVGGMEYWIERLKSGDETGSSLAANFLFSDEFLMDGHTDEEFIDLLYSTLLNREPDEQGRQFWQSKLASGTSRSSMLAAYIDLPEFAGICAQYGVLLGSISAGQIDSANMRAYLIRMYTEVFGRRADIEGLNYWQTNIQNGQQTVVSVAEYFVFSPETEQKNLTNEAFVLMLYRTFMGRTGEGGGVHFWLEQLESGAMNRRDVFNHFVSSPEFSEIKGTFVQ